MRVLVACEKTQAICKAFRALGIEAYSCDVRPAMGGCPEWHIMGDALEIINDGWDLIIAHPPCTYLSNIANRHHSMKRNPVEAINARTMKRIKAVEFFMKFVNADCGKIAIENPVGVMNTFYRKPDQIISPYMFSTGPDDKENFVTKKTCLWLKGLPPLVPWQTELIPNNKEMYGTYPDGHARDWVQSIPPDERDLRSATFPGIAQAIAEQWSRC